MRVWHSELCRGIRAYDQWLLVVYDNIMGKFKLETWYDPEGQPTVEYFTSLKECSALAASRSKEGLTVVIERVIESQETF